MNRETSSYRSSFRADEDAHYTEYNLTVRTFLRVPELQRKFLRSWRAVWQVGWKEE